MKTGDVAQENVDGTVIGRQVSVARVLATSFIGTSIEQYDFLLYGFAAGLVFNRLFFPSADSLVGTLSAFATFALGFIARPLGGIVCGHYGDTIGRKAMLILTLLMAGVATTLMGLLPTYAAIGVWAPILLVTLRIIQGFGYGGESIGAVVMAAEYVPTRRRGLYTSVIQAAGAAGLLLAALAIALFARLSEAQFLAWGWRVPFLLSIILVVVGLFIRLHIYETPVFAKMQAQGAAARMPLREVLRDQLATVLLCGGVVFGFSALFNTLLVFMASYATEQLKLPNSVVLIGVVIGAIMALIGAPLAGALSDRLGRRPVVIAGAAFLALYIFPFFWLVDSKNTGSIWLAFAGAFAGLSVMYAVLPTFLVEQFRTRVRYSGASVASQLGAVLGGGFAPLIATALLASAGGASWVVAAYVCVALLISLVSALLLKETYRDDLAEDAPELGRLVTKTTAT
jgi:MFS family permease